MVASSLDQCFKIKAFIFLKGSVILQIKIQPFYTKAMGQKNLCCQPGAVNGMVFKIGFCPGKNLNDGPIIQFD